MKVATGRFGDKLRAIYERLGYEVIVLPRGSVEERLEFILDYL
jgi:predicted ATPase